MKHLQGAMSRVGSKPLRTAVACALLAAAPLIHAASDTPTAVKATVTSSEAKTKYPIVLVHGLFGFDNVVGVDYFYGIPAKLAAAGAKVYVAQVSATNTSEIRGEQLLQELKNIRAVSGDPALKFNLIGHSQGSPTARYVAAVAPELVASVTSVGGANGGSKVADELLKVPQGSASGIALTGMAGLLARVEGLLSGKDPAQLPEVPRNALESLGTAGSDAFNLKYPQGLRPAGSPCSVKSGPAVVNGIRYYSWTGVKTNTNALDLSDLPLASIGAQAYGDAVNDGLVASCDSRLGTHLGDYNQNHLDEINQLFGLVNASLWNILEKKPPQLFLDQAARLKSAGL